MELYHFPSKDKMHFKRPIKNNQETHIRDCLILYDTDWNDFGYYTKFGLTYVDEQEKSTDIGTLKITYKGYRNYRNFRSLKPATKLSYGQVVLSSEYCSMGETMEYYTKMRQLFKDSYQNVLLLLRDGALYESIAKAFDAEPSYWGSLLRESSSIKVYNTVRKELLSQEIETDISFQYLFHPPYAHNAYEQELLKFDFSKNTLPYRVNILVGKNGSGKTQLLKSLSESLSGITGVGFSSQSRFKGKRPIVDRVITISYSAFDDVFRDRFEGRRDSSVSYAYCGIHSAGKLLTSDEIANNFSDSLQRIKQKKRFEQWKDIMHALLEKEHADILGLVVEKGLKEVPLSSGQGVLISTITETIANIEPGSLILIDELELHLHPNAISNVVRMLITLLDKFDSYAIMATHSPLIIQEIPSRYIQIMSRVDNILNVNKPSVECFGENITNITDEVFDVLDNESNYKTVLQKLSKRYSFEDVLELFDGDLSINAMTYLKACYRNGEYKI